MANVITCGTFDLFHVGQLQQRTRSVVRKELLYHGVLTPLYPPMFTGVLRLLITFWIFFGNVAEFWRTFRGQRPPIGRFAALTAALAALFPLT